MNCSYSDDLRDSKGRLICSVCRRVNPTNNVKVRRNCGDAKTLLGYGIDFAAEFKRWSESGFKLRAVDTVEKMFDGHCQPCDRYVGGRNDGQCAECKCSLSRTGRLKNKLAWATTRCPLDKWTEETMLDGLEVADIPEPGCCGK